MRTVAKLKSHAAELAKERINERATELYEKGLERASYIYDETLAGLDSAQEQIRKYGDVVSKEIQKNPIS